jgi:hypothetical protein
MIMMCLWRVAVLSRFLLLHMALSTIPTKPCTNQPQQQNKSSPNSYFIHAHSISPHLYTATESSSRRDNDYFGRRRSNNNNIYPSHMVGDRYNYIRQPLGRISLPPISPSSIIHNLLLTVKASIQQHSKTKTKTACGPTHIDTDDDVRASDNYMMATSSVSINAEKKVEEEAVLSASLPQKSSSSLLLNDDNDDNSDIFYRNDDDYFESSVYNSASSVGQKRRRTIWWMMDYDVKDNESEQQEHNQDDTSHTHPSFDTIQQVVRIKVQKPSKMEKDKAATSSQAQQQYIKSLTQPLMTESVWNQLTGMEWCTTGTDDIEHGNIHEQLLDSLAAMGENVARIDTPTEWIDWQVYSSSSSSSSSDQKDDLLDKDVVQVWTGKCIAIPPLALKSLTDSDDTNHQPPETEEKYLGVPLPFIKTRAILPYSIADVVDLLLDSKKVVTYNPWSLGRRDCWIDTSSSSNSSADTIAHNIRTSMITKIVQNRVQPPIPGARQVVSTTLLHARPIRSTMVSDEINDWNTTSWIIVSRSVGKNHIYNDESDAKTKTSRSDVLLGVNLLEPVRSKDGTIIDTNQCRLTTVTHVYSPSVPTAFAERLGVQSSIKFIQDIRNLKTKPANAAATTPSRKAHETAKVPN